MRASRAAAIFCLSLDVACAGKPPGRATPAAPKSAASSVSELTPFRSGWRDSAQRQAFARILDAELCPCRHPHSVADCVRAAQATCKAAWHLARYVARKLRAGTPEGAIIQKIAALFQESDAPAVDIPQDDAPVRGDPRAPVSLTVFSDFECPYCKRLVPVLESLHKRYPRGLKIAFKHFPLERVHENGRLAALAALAAQRQQKFWQMHDRLFERQGLLSHAAIFTIAREIGLDMARFERDVQAPELAAHLARDVALAVRLDVDRTPMVFVGGRRVYDRDAERLSDWVEAAFAASEAP